MAGQQRELHFGVVLTNDGNSCEKVSNYSVQITQLHPATWSAPFVG